MRRPELIARQGRCPSGLLGNVIARIMAKETSRENRYAMELLSLQPTDRVLEVGFGHGKTVAAMLNQVSSGTVAGVDLSPDMVKMAQRAAPRADLRRGSSNALPFPDDSFDKALAVHTVYFWDNLAQHLAEIARVLRPGGLLVLGFRPADAAALAAFPRTTHHFRNADEIGTVLRPAGFGRIETIALAGSRVVFIEAALASESP